MRINFFEEFPETGSLEKARLLDFPSTIYIAAKSFVEFERWKLELARINPLCEAAYWPVLERSYWVSPFSFPSELKVLLRDLRSNRGKGTLKVLIDLEIPLKKNFFYRNVFFFFTNKRLIKKIFLEAQANNIEILTAEYASSKESQQRMWRWLGLSYDIKKFPHKRIVMYYSSMLRGEDQSREWLVTEVRNFIKGKVISNSDLQVGLGAIDIGVLGNEPILEPERLAADLRFLRAAQIKTAVIFRLSGMNEEYVEVLKPFLAAS